VTSAEGFPVFQPKRRIHWLAAIVMAILLILILGALSPV
jgi:hypothetical protein